MTERQAQEPTVTVVTAVHNEAGFVREAVESILKQTWSDFEYLIVDDASSDETPKILATLDDPRIVVIRLDGQHGAAEARNVALRRARGRYIAIQDADDRSLPARLETEVHYLDRNPEVAMVGAGFVSIDELGRPTRIHVSQCEERQVGLSHGSVMFRRQCVDEVGYYRKSLIRSQDRDFMQRIRDRYETVRLPRLLQEYRLIGRKRTVRAVLRQCRYDRLADEIRSRPEIARDEASLRAFRDAWLQPRLLSRNWWRGRRYNARWCRYYGDLFWAQRRYGFALRHYATAALFDPPGADRVRRALRGVQPRDDGSGVAEASKAPSPGARPSEP